MRGEDGEKAGEAFQGGKDGEWSIPRGRWEARGGAETRQICRIPTLLP